ncbi:hypothetical protein GPECTOR_45g108 [Gonium pectorale]|uniref:C2 NT-type domain-containing protein n=1 Tax=Gonium pectorale TaxID=33097 RepID=A0A150G8T8_GONPE|nr:hypothetical protein GPECTOR_45g108 [Gonium pectorale]|eukprot:KXZ46238.1 hypothetical protein GPECTOR_45g108 [Gonium pectorale]
MGTKQHSPGQTCVLLWVRGETIHVTEDSVGQTVLSWSDTYFSQLVTLTPSGAGGGGFRPKECKFKVQQKGKTIAKTAMVDLAKYCNESGAAREASVRVPLQPSGTLYFVISTMPSAEQSAPSCTSAMSEYRTSNGSAHPHRGSAGNGPNLGTTSTGIAAASTASAGSSAQGTPNGAGTGGGAGSSQGTPAGVTTVFGLGSSQRGVAAALGGSVSGTGDDPDRPSTSGRHQKPHRLQQSASMSRAAAHLGGSGGPEGADGSGFFRRIARMGSNKHGAAGAAAAAEAVAGAAGSGGGGVGGAMRNIESAELASGSPSGARRALGSSGSAGGLAGAYSPGRRGTSGLAPAASAPACDGAADGASSSSSDAAVVGAAAAAAAATISPKRAAGATADGGGSGGGWASWFRGGLGLGRSSNHSATGTSTTGPHSQASLHGPGCGGGEHDSSALVSAITDATEVAELRELALDMLHERDAWRGRALSAQDALGRAQTARGSAVRDAQRLEVQVREYKEELGRRTDGSLLQELVEAKVRIAELANENLRLRRQITHMGPLFYDDSGDDGPASCAVNG